MGASDSSCTEKVGNMDVNNLQTGMSGLAASGMNVTCTRSSLYSKSKNGKKALSYNPKEISSQILRAKKTVGAARVLSRARAKLAMLKKAQATGEYDSAELENAIAHAKRMVECADMKVNNLREEDRLRKRAEDKEELKVEKQEMPGDLKISRNGHTGRMKIKHCSMRIRSITNGRGTVLWEQQLLRFRQLQHHLN